MKDEPTRGPHVKSITIVATGEKISRFELDKRLIDMTIDNGAELHSPKHGRMFVKLLDDGVQVKMVLENEAGERV